MLSDGLIFSGNKSLPIDSSWMAFKIPATFKGKKLFFVFVFLIDLKVRFRIITLII